MQQLIEMSGGDLWGDVTVRLLTNLTLDLLTCPAGGIASSAAEVLVRASLPRHRGKEVVTEVLPEVAVGEGIGKITREVSRILLRRARCTYPITPHADRRRASVRLLSCWMVRRRSKMESMNGTRTLANKL
jgi:hypothetical protein